ncbi:MAG: biopolymer transporter Tol [Opitutaceae bacterium]|jgi:TolB protein|nr:biopolymer transporter Tol [Opitutaceae bacterium]
MKHNFALFLLALIAATTPALAPAQTNNQPVTKYELDPLGKNTIPIVIAGDAQLAAHARKAFSAHGAYSVLAADGKYTFTFTSVAPAQVRVAIAQKGSPTITNITASGASALDALYRAADAAVKATASLPGFFTSRLAFVSNNTGADEIYVSDLFLNEARAITNNRATILMPRWSPDGRRILFTSYFKYRAPSLFRIDVNNLLVTDYAAYNGTNMSGRYSPDGSRVAMVIGIAGGNTNLYIGGPDGRAKPTPITNSSEAKASPCFSPDGQRIVFVMQPGPQLYIMPAAGGVPARLVTRVNYAAEPDWSRANPNLIAFTTQVGGAFRIAVYDMSTGRTRIITPKSASGAPLGGDFIEPSWLPDGRHVVCTQRPATGNQRFLYILDTGDPQSKDDQMINRATQLSALRAEQASVLAQP